MKKIFSSSLSRYQSFAFNALISLMSFFFFLTNGKFSIYFCCSVCVIARTRLLFLGVINEVGYGDKESENKIIIKRSGVDKMTESQPDS